MTTDFGFFDLVSLPSGDRFTLISAPQDGQILATKNTWPIEFNEIEGHKPPSPQVLKLEELTVVCGGRHRLTVLADTMREHADKSADAQGLDWDDVNQALFEAAKILPSYLLDIKVDAGSWELNPNIPDDLVPFCKPAAILLSTHVIGAGEADSSDVSAAYEAARLVPDSFTTRGTAPAR